jgi:iron complex transport system substrate-binding protein
MTVTKFLLGLLWLALAVCTADRAYAQTKDVVVVGGALAEIVYALGAEKRIAGTDTTAIFPPAARDTPKVGYQRSLSAEGVLSLKPKIVLAASEAGPTAALAQIRQAGVKVELFPAEHTAAQVIENIARVAAALEIPKQGAALQAKMRAELDQMRDTVSSFGGRKPKVLFLLAHGGTPQVSGEGTSAHAMIVLAGGENAFSGFKGYRPLTSEGAVTAAPDVILISEQGLDAQGGIDGLLKRPGLSLTPAGQAKRIVKLDALQLLGFGPRLPQTVVELARLIRE